MASLGEATFRADVVTVTDIVSRAPSILDGEKLTMWQFESRGEDVLSNEMLNVGFPHVHTGAG